MRGAGLWTPGWWSTSNGGEINLEMIGQGRLLRSNLVMILHRLNLGYSKPPLHVYEVDSSMFASAGTQQALNARRGYYTSKQDILSPLTV